MPKKYKQKSLLTKPSSSAHSNLSLSSPPPSQDGPTTRTVNDLLQESRRGTGNDAVLPVQSSASLPPSLRVVLDVPTPPPPAPRYGIRGPTRLRRIPGPPPPQSWLKSSIHAPAEIRNVPWHQGHMRSRIQKHSSILPGASFPSEKTLQHAIMKEIAIHWSWHVQYDHEYLAELPVKIKQTLMSYLAIFNEDHNSNLLHLLFPDNSQEDELNEVTRLDLGDAIGGWSSLKRIERVLDAGPLALPQGQQSIAIQEDIPDAWDADEVSHTPHVSFQPSSNGMRFRNLKHLSLAVTPNTSGSVASWAGLIALTGKLSTITSLSLAYWPQPTYTPNASTGMVKMAVTHLMPRPAVTYGGSNHYTAFDNDWREAAGILRSLSRSLYCLKWLDLTGCGSWFPALIWQSSDDESSMTASMGPDWNGSWRGLDHLVLAVGWSPDPPPQERSQTPFVPFIQDAMEEGEGRPTSRTSELLSQVQLARLGSQRMPDSDEPESWNVEHERSKHYHRKEVETYNQILDRAKSVAQQVRATRKEHGGKWLDVTLSPQHT